jgi:hypothetical protein
MMNRPERMDEIVSIMSTASHEHRKLSSEEARHLDELLQNMFHK